MVMHGSGISMPAVLARPQVLHTYDKATKAYGRELGYVNAKGPDLAASAITDILVRTEWPMGQLPETFNYEGPDDPFFLGPPAKKQWADKWGIKVDPYFDVRG